jgi:hypothetical protein
MDIMESIRNATVRQAIADRLQTPDAIKIIIAELKNNNTLPVVFDVAVCNASESTALKMLLVETNDKDEGKGTVFFPLSFNMLSQLQKLDLPIERCRRFLISPVSKNIKNPYRKLAAVFKIDWRNAKFSAVYKQREKSYLLFDAEKMTLTNQDTEVKNSQFKS